MSENHSLGNTGIQVIKSLEDKDIIEIANQVSNKIMTAFPDSNLSYLDIYKTLLDTPMYYAEIPEGLSKANYYYKDSSIYFDIDMDLSEIDEFVFHECIHKLQEHKDKKGNLTRLGISEVNELSVKGTALNEGAIQYLTTRTFSSPKKYVTVYDITLPSRTEYYPILTNIVASLAYLLNENTLIDSTINGNEEFKIEIIDTLGENQYHYIERNLNDILKTKDSISELQKNYEMTEEVKGKILSNMEHIKNLYFDTQNIIYISYFDNMLKRVENDIELSILRKKLYSYKSLIGTNENNNDFENYCADFERRANLKVEEFRNRKDLTVVSNNPILKMIRKIKKLFTNSPKEYYK